MTAVFILAAPLIIGLFGDPGGDLDLAVGLSRILFPIVVLLGLSGVVVGILNAYDQFTIPALTPVAWNLVIILGLVLGIPSADGEEAELYSYAGAIVVATLVQLLLPLPWLRGLDGRLRLAFDWRDPAVKKFLTLMLPVTLALGLININTLIGDGVRLAVDRPRARPARRSTWRFASTCSRRGSSRSRSPPCSSRRCRASRPAATCAASGRRSTRASGRSGSC